MTYISQDAREEKTWVDKMPDTIECISLDPLGVTIAIGHGEKVSVIDQSTICAYVPTLLHTLNAEVF